MNERRVDQLYVFMATIEDDPPTSTLSDAEITEQHHAYLQDIKDQGKLMGAGSARD
jgi:uncharacterized protein YciI